MCFIFIFVTCFLFILMCRYYSDLNHSEIVSNTWRIDGNKQLLVNSTASALFPYALYHRYPHLSLLHSDAPSTWQPPEAHKQTPLVCHINVHQ